MPESDAKHRLINRVERLQASRVAIEVEMAMSVPASDVAIQHSLGHQKQTD
jgi:hypothetical protein